MKKNYITFFTAFIISFASSCTNEEYEGLNYSMERSQEATSFSNRVSLSDVETLFRSSFPIETRANIEPDMEFIVDDKNDTLFYIVNHPDGGWTMYASDKRVPAVVAESEIGKFDADEAQDIMGPWLSSMEEDMKTAKTSPDSYLSFNAYEIEQNRDFWAAACDIETYLQKKTAVTKAEIKPVIPEDGAYVLASSQSYGEVYDCIDHLTRTRWDQGSPYNMYCPYKSSGNGRSPAGCVAIAGAQMLYYLHYKIGVPVNIPDTAYCFGRNNGYYDWGQWYIGTDVWSKLHNDGDRYSYTTDNYGNVVSEASLVAPFIANIGNCLLMEYGDDGSGASSEDLPHTFSLYGVSCQYGEYNLETVIDKLVNDSMPTIVSAYGTKHKKLFRTYYRNGHAFIVDGYKRMRTVTENTYIYVYDPNEELLNPVPNVPEMEETIYSAPYVTYIKMNWGWENQSYNNAWFAPTSSWVITMPDNTYTFDYKRKMVYNFQQL